jgi:hypothetical protein
VFQSRVSLSYSLVEKITWWLLVGLVTIGSIALFGSGGGDDSHITWWVVDQLRNTGRILNLNGAPIEQSSSLGLVLIVAALRVFIHVPTPALGVVLSVTATAGTCLMTAKVARSFAPELALPSAWLVATSGPLVYWGTSGMETAVAAFAAVWLLDAIAKCLGTPLDWANASARKQSALRLLELAAATLLFITIRPENHLLVLGVFGGGLLYSLCATGRSALEPARLRPFFAYALTVIAIVAALFVWRHAVFQAWFPHPVTAKAGGDPRWANGWKYLVTSVNAFQPALFALLPISLGVVLAGCLLRRVQPLAGYVVALAVLGLVFICASGGDWMSCGRFLANQLPVWWLVVVISLSIALQRQLRTVRWALLALGAANLWFLFGIARLGGANGYPITAALKVVPAARQQYQLQHYSFLELSNKSHLRDALLAEELKRVIAQVLPATDGKVWVASGQAGGVPYHTFSAFPNRLRFIDYWGLVDAAAMPCIPRSALRHSSLGVALSPELMFKYRQAILQDCGIPMPDIVFNTSLREGTRKGLEARGYRVVYFQRGAMPNFDTPSILKGGTSIDSYIAVRRELADKLGLTYREIRWSITG